MNARDGSVLALGVGLSMGLALVSSGLTLEVLSPRQSVAPGAVVTVAFSLTYAGPADGAVRLELQVPAGWTPLPPPPTLDLPAGRAVTVFAGALVPETAPPGRAFLTLSAALVADPTVTATAGAWVEVLSPARAELLAPLGQAALPGTTVSYAFTLVHHGSTPEAYALEARSQHGYRTRVRPPLVWSVPGEARTVRVELVLPPTAPTEPDRLTLTATALEVPRLRLQAEVRTEVLPPRPQEVGGSLFLELTGRLNPGLRARRTALRTLGLPFALEAGAALPSGAQLELALAVADLLRSEPKGTLTLSRGAYRLDLQRQRGQFALSVQTPLVGGRLSQSGTTRAWSWWSFARLAHGRAGLGRSAVLEEASESPLREEAVFGELFYRLGPWAAGLTARSRRGELGTVLDELELAFSLKVAPVRELTLGTTVSWAQQLGADPRQVHTVWELHSALGWRLGESFQLQLQAGSTAALRLAAAVRLAALEVRWGGSFAARAGRSQYLSLRWGGLGAGWQAGPAGEQLSLSWDGLPWAEGLSLRGQQAGARRRLEAALRFEAAGLRLDLGAAWERTLEGSGREATLNLSAPFSLPLPFWAVKGRLEGTVFRDADRDGRHDPDEPGVGEVFLRLGPAWARSDGSGLYRFPPLPAGDYELVPERLPPGLVPGLTLPRTVRLRAGQVSRLALPLGPVALIHGLVFQDADQNGRHDPGEPPLSGVILVLDGPEGFHRRQETGPDGQFAFSVPPGAYRLALEPDSLPPGRRLTTPAAVELVLSAAGERRFVAFGLAPQPLRFAPVAAFTFRPASPRAGESVTFDASASQDPDGQITAYAWDFDDDGIQDAAGRVVRHAFPAPGSYRVTLTVTDDQGLRGRATATVEVRAP